MTRADKGRAEIVVPPAPIPVAPTFVSFSGRSDIEAAAAALWLGSYLSGAAFDEDDLCEVLATLAIAPTDENIAAVSNLVKRVEETTGIHRPS